MSPVAIAPSYSTFRRSHVDAKRKWGLTALGAIAAILIFEFGLSFFISGWDYPKTPIREIREYSEGIAVSHFVPDGFGTYGNRLTGNPVLPGAPTVLILGDSHVVQEAVLDHQTMGAIVERLSRSQSRPVNVRQYGWHNTAAPTYIGYAPDLLHAVHPKIVLVLLNQTDFYHEALDTGWYWTMRIHPDYSIDLVDRRALQADSKMTRFKQIVDRSHLMLALGRRAVLVFRGGEADNPGRQDLVPTHVIQRVARASIKGLKAAYGSRLIVGYLPHCAETCPPEPDDYEARMLSACNAENVDCFSTRPVMSADMRTNHRILRGFHNTAPGVYHLNEDGLALTGAAIWREVSKHLVR